MSRWRLRHVVAAAGVVVTMANCATACSTGQGEQVAPITATTTPHTVATNTSEPIPPPEVCPLKTGRCLGVRRGDIDGDGPVDQAGLNLNNSDPGKLTVTVRLATGVLYSQVISTEVLNLLAGWLGISDVNGDGRGDLFVVNGGGAHSVSVSVLEYRQGKLEPLRSDFGNGLEIDASLTSNAGFTCENKGGRARLVIVGVAIDRPGAGAKYLGTEQTFEADNSGAMRQVSRREVSYPSDVDPSGNNALPKELESRIGANCPGLDKFLK